MWTRRSAWRRCKGRSLTAGWKPTAIRGYGTTTGEARGDCLHRHASKARQPGSVECKADSRLHLPGHEYPAGKPVHCLEPLLIGDVAVPPVAADLLLGRDRVARSQLIKQPDVLMLHHLVPDQVEPGSLGPNLDYYGPRTAHGSSLYPAVTASLLARAGRPDEALAMLRVALALDLDDLTGMTGAGLHMANLGGIWQAVVAGLAGVRVRAGVLTADPRLPAAWDGLHLRFRCLGRKVRLDITHDRTEIWADAPLAVALAGAAPRTVTGTATFRAAG